MTDHSGTTRLISQITDAGSFERLATAVLRKSQPSTYGNVSHPGMNPDGKTVKSPVDCIGWISPSHVVMIAHSTASSVSLRDKWLHDPATVKPRKIGKPTAPLGDLQKAIKLVKSYRVGISDLAATLALTTNREPDADLTFEVQKWATQEKITIDVWPCSRLANFLDNDPEGQWIRNDQLGVMPERLSRSLLNALSRKSIQPFLSLLNQSEQIERQVFLQVAAATSFLIGSSGMGKTTICLKRLSDHIGQGGYGLVLAHETIATATTVEQAIDTELRKYQSSLQIEAANQALDFCPEWQPFVLVVEDINRADNPPALLSKLAAWIERASPAKTKQPRRWVLLCPTWPRVLDALAEPEKKVVTNLSQTVGPYTDDEARQALSLRARNVDPTIPLSKVVAIAKALGNDPLLIALYDFAAPANPSAVVDQFVINEARRLAVHLGRFTQTDYLSATRARSLELLKRRKLDPSWLEIESWLSQKPSVIDALRDFMKSGTVLRLIASKDEERLATRHDRVLISLLSQAIAFELAAGILSGDYMDDPYFAAALGEALLKNGITAEAVHSVRRLNPLALFHAFQLVSDIPVQIRDNILQAIHDWLKEKTTHGRANRALRWQALRVLAETSSEEVISITGHFRDTRWVPYLEARFRNGNIRAGVALCHRFEPGVTVEGRNLLIANVKEEYRRQFAIEIGQLLSNPENGADLRIGSLRLAGYLADPSLAAAILTSWTHDKEREQHLADYLWAAAQCCGDDSVKTLGPICDAWAQLPDNRKDNLPSPRDDLAAHHVSWAFRESLPIKAIPFFLERACNADLHWQITYMLRTFDHPDVLDFLARELAASDRKLEGTNSFWPFPHILCDEWRRRQEETGLPMSHESKARLLRLSLDPDNDHFLQKSAFKLWASTKSPDDASHIQAIDEASSLYDQALWARVERTDLSAIPLLLEKLKTENAGYWWHLGRYVWCDALSAALHEAVRRCGENSTKQWGESKNIEWILSELLMGLDTQTAENILLAEWDQIRYSPLFVQAALFVASNRLIALANKAIEEATDPREMLKHLTMQMGYKVKGRSGITRIGQLNALAPHIQLLDSGDIVSLWDLCNEKGWVAFRKQHLDARLAVDEKFSHLLKSEVDTDELDMALGGKKRLYSPWWLEHNLRHGIPLEKTIQSLLSWLDYHKTIDALEIVAEMFIHSARRTDLQLLQEATKSWLEAIEIVQDTTFGIRQRTLN